MIDHELEQILQNRFRAEGARVGAAPAGLHASVAAIPDTTGYGAARYPTRRVLLLAATILLTLTVGGALAIGSGLIRLPQPPDLLPGPPADSLSTVILGPGACDDTLDDDLVFEMSFTDSSGRPAQLTVDASGWVLRGPEPWLPEEGIPWEQRTLTTGGLSRLLADVGSSGLRDCMQVPVTGPHSVSARLGDGVAVMGLSGRLFLRAPSRSEVDAAEVLAARLNGPDLGTTNDEWVDPEWLPYEPDRWQIILHRFEGSAPCCWTPGDWQDVPWRDMTLPDGSTFLTVGAAYPDAPPSDYVETRCHVIPAADRDAWVEAFGEHAEGADNVWMLADGGGIGGVQGGGVLISVTPLLPPDPGCQGSPDPAPRENLIDDLDVCALVPASAEWGNGHALEDHGGGWASCEYFPAAVTGWVFASRHPVTSDEALAVVANQFGEVFTTDEVSGQSVYLNACIEFDPDCTGAIAISKDPYLVILVPERQNSPDRLRAWAELVIESLPVVTSD